MGSFLSGFTDRFIIALSLWPVISVILTLPILAYLYNRDGLLRFWSVIGAYLSVLYGLGLIFFTLWPLPSGDSGLGITFGVEPQFDLFAFIGDIQKDGLPAVLQIIANIAFFAPLGFIFKRGLRLKLSVSMILSFLVSLLIETAQLTGLFGIYAYSYRTFDVDDLVWNTLGALGGWLIAKLTILILPQEVDGEKTVDHHPGFVHRLVAFMLDMTIVAIVGFCTLMAGSVSAHLMGFTYENVFAWVSAIAGIVALICFIAVELIVPWLHGGQTPGGLFVRMTVESHPRSSGHRAAFYCVRLLVIVACTIIVPVAPIAVTIYFLFAREMPYDAIP